MRAQVELGEPESFISHVTDPVRLVGKLPVTLTTPLERDIPAIWR